MTGNKLAIRFWNSSLRIMMVPFLALSLITFDVSAAIGSMGEAINTAGRQRMLSQRIAQSYLQIGTYGGTKAPKQLARCILEFDQNLKALYDYAPGASARKDLRKVELIWSGYRRLAEGQVNKDNAAILLKQSNRILAAAHAYVGKLQAISGTKSAELINVSGRQRMLSQRITKNFLASHWGVDKQAAHEALYEDIAEYDNVLSYLESSELNTPEIDTELSKARGRFKYATKGFDKAMSLSGGLLIHVVTGSTDAMLYGMNKVTGMYAKQLSK